MTNGNDGKGPNDLVKGGLTRRKRGAMTFKLKREIMQSTLE